MKNGGAADAERGMRLLMGKYQERLYWTIYKLVGTHEDANDVLQNCFIKAYRGIGRFEEKSKLFTWLYRIATNESFTFLQKRKKHNSLPVDDENLGIATSLKAERAPDSNQIQILLQEAIKLLPEKQQLVFTMRYFDEMPYDKISENLGTSVGALKASYHHAVKKVEKYLKSQDLF